MKRALIVPAAGRGSRLGSDLPKVLYPVGGRPMLDILLELYEPRVDRVALVVHPSFEQRVEDHCRARGTEALVVLQPEPTGMLDAILLSIQKKSHLLTAVTMSFVLDNKEKRDEHLRPASPTLDATQILKLIDLRLQNISLVSGVVDITLHAEADP